MTTKSPPSIIRRVISDAARAPAAPPAQHRPQPPEPAAPPEPEGAERADEESLLTGELYITSKPPRDVAILHVYAGGPGQYCVWGTNPEVRDLQTGPRERPHLALGEMVLDHRGPTMEMPLTILELMGEFSHPQVEVRRWLRELYARFGPRLQLVIADHTDYEIPWEMFELSSRQFVGALFPVARWEHFVGDDDHLFLDFELAECSGHILSYVNREELEGLGPESEVLSDFNALTFEDVRQFVEQLRQESDRFALVFMACHGICMEDIRAAALGSLRDARQRMRLAELRGCDLALLRRSRAIVFINACHSGRLRAEGKYLRDAYRRGFAELFLSKGARGVIGTLGGVNDSYAAEIARDLLREASRRPERPVAALLCELRARAASALAPEPGERELLRFIYTFMYVYYGNPSTMLRLRRRED
jgi:hypothetical protein